MIFTTEGCADSLIYAPVPFTALPPWEREIDELVYALYGLTPEEIKLVEGAAK